jgi:hypothetical protein
MAVLLTTGQRKSECQRFGGNFILSVFELLSESMKLLAPHSFWRTFLDTKSYAKNASTKEGTLKVDSALRGSNIALRILFWNFYYEYFNRVGYRVIQPIPITHHLA